MIPIMYTRCGEYLIPNIVLRKQPNTPIGKYGHMRKTYLKNHRKGYYSYLLLTENLYSHLLEIDQAANIRLEQLMDELSSNKPPPDKETDQIGWAAHMNGLKAQAEEFIMTEIVYS